MKISSPNKTEVSVTNPQTGTTGSIVNVYFKVEFQTEHDTKSQVLSIIRHRKQKSNFNIYYIYNILYIYIYNIILYIIYIYYIYNIYIL